MEWQPQDEPLRQLACCLRDSLNPYNRTAQKEAEQMLVQATSSPDYVNYITYLFSTPQIPPTLGIAENVYNMVRFAAAMNLKTKIRVAYSTIPQPSLAYIRSATLIGLRDADAQVRNSAGSIITELLQQAGLLAWPEVLNELLGLVENTSRDVPVLAQEAAMSALAKVCEDNRKVLDRDYQGQRPLDVIIPKLMEFTSSGSPKIRSMALGTIHVFLPNRPQALIASMDLFLAQLFQLSDDQSTDVRRMVCQTFAQLVDFAPEKLIPHMEGLVNYIIMQQNNQEDPELALDAAEFWLVAGEQAKLQQPLAPHMSKIVPVLLRSMVYDEDDAIRLSGEGDDAELEDREQDLRPQFAKSKGSRLDTSKTEAQANGAASAEEDDEDDLSEGEIEDSEFGDDPEDEWTLRKCSAAALDVFSNVYHQPIFEVILPYLKETLRHEQWPQREAAVLTLGAVADGCMDAVTPHLPELVPYLISLLNDAQPVVRQITCWCLGRYSEWASHLADPAERARFFEPMMEGILRRMLDGNKKVQEAAASAFASLEEKSDANLIPYCEPILRQFVQCFGKYKDRNMYILYDCVQTLAECVMGELAKPHLVDILMPALIDRYNKVTDQSRELFPLLECLGYIAAAYGDAFAPFAPPLFQRCMKIIYENLQEYVAHVNNQAIDEPDKDFLVTSLDLLSAIIQAIDPSKSGELVASSQPRFFDLLCFCMEDPNYEVRQSSYALLGDCAINIFPQLEPFIPNIIPTLIKQLDLDMIKDDDRHTGFSVLNNACWSCGEIAVTEKADLSPYADKLYRGLFVIINNEEIIDSVNENAAMALGRLGFCCSDQLAAHLAEYAGVFLKSMNKIEFTREKASAFLGFNHVVMKNPQALESCLGDYFQAIAAFPAKSLHQEDYRDVQSSFEQVLQGYKNMIPNFDSFLTQLPPHVVQKLRSTYQI
ncbi:putative importin beta-2 subunit [Aspergillus clavatus NRRL 1]|uniref:Importin beta-2 subunit, putative n=1 Tax=Aspergillus clavatus (strain ATCC 1007 / CBS 513.65 / DSM 816 / NCTC 3887 / NRRL 1 / QM 1276 / 107) TaxID=344612 RepID=A1CNM0_ASPCL|nr:importin beta-2 subunit, putative [Aspergillus clavatus NRRL 1]EAW07241.1 importin beta-2 subunit, putative [Aspergillus clavatus NRRL 1]